MNNQEKDHIDLKRPQKGTAFHYYSPITYLPMMWKILRVQIREEIYFLLINHGPFPKEQNGCHEGTRRKDICYTLINTSSRRVKQDEKM